MSHFAVMVIGENIESQLIPFCEHEEYGDEHFTFKDCTDEVMDDWENKTESDWYPEEYIRVEKMDVIERLRAGEEVSVMAPSYPEIKLDNRYRVTFARNGKSEDVYVVTTAITTNVRQNAPFSDHIIKCKMIESPKKISVKDRYDSIEAFAKDWHGYKKEGDKYGYYHNENAKWDWYQMGGRWTGFLKGKDGVEGDVGESGLMTPEASAGYYDSLKKKDIDVEFMRQTAREEAEEEFDCFMETFEGIEIPSWTEIRERHGNNIDDARDEFNATKFKEHMNNLRCHENELHRNKQEPENKYLSSWDWAGDLHAYFSDFDRDAFIQNRVESSIITFALLKDGKWYERGNMGWWASVSNENDDWNSEFYKMFNELDDEELITIVDCHI